MINDDIDEESSGKNSMIESFGSDELEIDSVEELKPSSKNKKRETKLISNNIFKSSLNP